MLSSSNSLKQGGATSAGSRGIWDLSSECNSDVPAPHLRGWSLVLTDSLTSRKHVARVRENAAFSGALSHRSKDWARG